MKMKEVITNGVMLKSTGTTTVSCLKQGIPAKTMRMAITTTVASHLAIASKAVTKESTGLTMTNPIMSRTRYERIIVH